MQPALGVGLSQPARLRETDAVSLTRCPSNWRRPDTTFLREMIGFAAQRQMALETSTLGSVAPGERSAGRTTQRNGYRDRNWQTRAGTIELRSPKQRYGSLDQLRSFSPGLSRAAPHG